MSLRRASVALLIGQALAGIAYSGERALAALANSAPVPSFGMRYGANPRPHNGGARSGAAAAKRAARKRRNVRMHPRGAA